MNSISAILVAADAALAASARRCLADLPIRVVVDEPSFANWDEFCTRVAPLSPDVIILDLGILRDPIEETMARVQRMPKPPAVIVMHIEAQADTILRVIRAGAIEYCYPPVEMPLRAALEKLIKQRAEAAPNRGAGKIYGFLGAKGGCGGTTVAAHAALALRGLLQDEVLLVDLDLNGGMIEFLLKCKSQYTVLQAMQNAHRLDASFWRALVADGGKNLDVLLAPPMSAHAEAMPVDRIPGVLQFARSSYAATVVDMGRFLTMGALTAATELDRMLVVTTLDVLALHHARKIVEAMLDAGYGRERLGLVINRVTNQRDIEPEDVEKLMGVPIEGILADDPTSIQEAYPEGKMLDAESRLSQHITRMARKLAGLPEVQQKKKFLFFGS